ncbi:hypothetical protein [Trujillonella endophytica]|uniref:Uncharacterized protein n=1 Tax=Trujillonella endophytica TaxID=673521 RepID=A0A1H8V342_9ACTN|nr:hypothetical protein [Trujillella endophytica]SEP09653.1 hypothetical protein SAMN05660991_03235 [Trujillella endophytica]
MRPALDDPATVATLAAYRGGALRWLLGGGVAVVVAVVAGMAAIAIARDTGEPVPFVGLGVVALLLGAPVALAAGGGSLLRARRWSAALAHTPWQPGVLRTGGAAVLSFEPAGSDEPEPVPLRLQSTTSWRVREVQRLDGAEVTAAPVGGGEWVFTADGLGTLIGARELRRRR